MRLFSSFLNSHSYDKAVPDEIFTFDVSLWTILELQLSEMQEDEIDGNCS